MIFGANKTNLFLCQFCLAVRFAFGLSSFVVAIFVVLAFSAKEQMTRPHTSFIIAVVQDADFWRDDAVGSFKHYTMSNEHDLFGLTATAAFREKAISRQSFISPIWDHKPATCPFPTSACFSDGAKKVFVYRNSSRHDHHFTAGVVWLSKPKERELWL